MTVAHGTYEGYLRDDCRCDDCRDAWYRYGKQTRHERLNGNPRLVDGREALAHIERLSAELGVSVHAITLSAGVSRATYTNIKRNGGCHRDTSAAILAVRGLEDLRDETLIPSGPAVELRNRLRERLGTWQNIATAAGLGREAVRQMHVARRVRLGTYRALQRLEAGFRVSCEDCGAPPLNGGRWCLRCFQAHASPPEPVRRGCGTQAGYTAHRRAGTTPCRACKDAHTAGWSRAVS